MAGEEEWQSQASEAITVLREEEVSGAGNVQVPSLRKHEALERRSELFYLLYGTQMLSVPYVTPPPPYGGTRFLEPGVFVSIGVSETSWRFSFQLETVRIFLGNWRS